MASGLLSTYLAEGLAASRPATPDTGSAIAFYWSTDTDELSAWFENAWVEDILAGGGGGGSLADGDYGDVTVSGSGTAIAIDSNAVSTAKIAADAVTYAKIQDASATKRVLGRNTAGSGDFEEVTIEQLFSWIAGTAAQGDIFYRDGSGVARLAAGTSGQFLKTQGAGANPVWATGVSQSTGTWTPVVAFGGASVGITYSVQLGQYVRTGNLVTATCYVLITNKGSSTGSITISGLPFTARNISQYFQGGAVGSATGTPTGKIFQFFVSPNTTVISVKDATNNATADNADVVNGNEFLVTLTYECEP